MNLDMTKEISSLRSMSASELRAKHLEVFGESNKSNNREYLIKRIAWRIQANAYGDLSERAKERAQLLANDADLRTTAPKKFKMATDAILSAKMKVNFNANSRLPPAGSTLMRNYRGKEIVVFVLPKGFEYEGQIYRTISGVVKAITGTKWNGYEFFGLK